MSKNELLNKGKFLIEVIYDAIRDLFVWLFASFILPLVQLIIMKLSTKPFVMDENAFNIIFVTIASFLTGIFFVTDFWKRKRIMIRMMLLTSYLISFGLFTISLIQELYSVTIFKLDIYKLGALIALILAILVGFFSKYDEKMEVPRAIANEAKNLKESSINGKPIKM